MFSKEDFQAWGKKDVVLFASVMTRIEGREDDDLLTKYGFRGFPSFAILDAEGEAITKQMGRDLASMQTAASLCLRSFLYTRKKRGERGSRARYKFVLTSIARAGPVAWRYEKAPIEYLSGRREML